MRSLGLATCFACPANARTTAALRAERHGCNSSCSAVTGARDEGRATRCSLIKRGRTRTRCARDLLFACDAHLAHACPSHPLRGMRNRAEARADAQDLLAMIRVPSWIGSGRGTASHWVRAGPGLHRRVR